MKFSFDLYHSLRLIRKNPDFVAIFVLVIGLGMGIAITMYSLISNAAYKPLPYPDGDRYVAIKRVDLDTGRITQTSFTLDSYIYRELKAELQSYTNLGATRNSSAIFSDGEITQKYLAANITPNLFVRSIRFNPPSLDR